MAAKETEQSGIVIDLETARQLCALYNGTALADKFFKSCQNTEFRQHIQGTYKAANVAAAFEKLKQQIEEAEKQA